MEQFYSRLVLSICSENCFKVLGSFVGRQKTRLQISELVKNTSAKLKEASEADLHGAASVRMLTFFMSFSYYAMECWMCKRTFTIEPIFGGGTIGCLIDDVCILILCYVYIFSRLTCSQLRRLRMLNWQKISNQFSKSFRKLRDLQLKEK